MKKSLFLACLCCFVFANGGNLKKVKENIVQKDINNAIEQELKKVENEKKIINRSTNKKYVLLTIKNMGEALFYLKNKEKIKAEEKIKYVLFLLNNHLKENKVPVDNKTILIKFKGSLKDAKVLIQKAKKNIQKEKYQLASRYLNLLKDELDIVTIFVDTKNLEQRLKEINQLIKNNHLNKAFKKLALTFKDKNIVKKDLYIYPLGIIKAVYLINHSKIINNMKNKTEKDYDNIVKLLKRAKKELLLDKTMGYFFNSKLQREYIYLITVLNELIEDALKHKESGSYKKITNILSTIKEKTAVKIKNPKNEVISNE
jgi:hypothetical protein